MSLIINNTTINKYMLDTPVKETMDAELDQFTFTIKQDTKDTSLFIKGNKVVFNTKVFMLFNAVESKDGALWTYQIECLSPTKLLENLIIDGMAMTRSENLKKQFQHLILKVKNQLKLQGYYYTDSNNNPIDFIQYSLSDLNLLNGESGRDFFWNGQQTLREILDDFMEVVDARIQATDFTFSNGNITSITIKPLKNERINNNIITDSSNIEEALTKLGNAIPVYNYEKTADNEYKVGKLKSIFKNGVNENHIITGWQPLRNDDIMLDDTKDWHLLTQHPIYSIHKLVVIVPCVVELRYLKSISGELYPASIQDIKMGIPIDITNNVVEKQIWDAMSADEQKKNLYFVRGQKGIYGFLTKYKWGDLGMLSRLVIQNALAGNPTGAQTMGILGNWNDYLGAGIFSYSSSWGSITSWYKNTTYHFYNGVEQRENDIYSILVTETPQGATQDWSEELKGVICNCEFTPYIDGYMEATKATNTNCDNLAIIKNQNDSNIDLIRYEKSQQSMLNRLGEEQIFIDSISNNVLSLGDYFKINTDRYLITQIEYTNYDNARYKIRYTFSKNFNASNSQIRLNREKRSYDIPKKNVIDRIIPIKMPVSINNVDTALIYVKNELSNVNGYAQMALCKYGELKTYLQFEAMDNYGIEIQKTTYSNTRVNVALTYAFTEDTIVDGIQYVKGEKDGYTLFLTNSSVLMEKENYDINNIPFITPACVSELSQSEYIQVDVEQIMKDKMERLIFVLYH